MGLPQGVRTYLSLTAEGGSITGARIPESMRRAKGEVVPRLQTAAIALTTGIGVMDHNPEMGRALVIAAVVRTALAPVREQRQPVRETFRRLGLSMTTAVAVGAPALELTGPAKWALLGAPLAYVMGSAAQGVVRIRRGRESADPVIDSTHPEDAG